MVEIKGVVMEEKERYVIRYDLDYNQCLIDTEENQGVGDYIQIVKLLNQQDKRIKELEEENQQLKVLLKATEITDIHNELADLQINNECLESENQQLKQQLEEMQNEKNELISKYRYWRGECYELKQQLHDLPKKIIDEIEKSFTEYLPLKDKTGAGFYSRLNTILKKYGGEDE